MATVLPHDRWLRPLYLGLAITFALVGILFAAFPDGTIDALNAVGNPFGFSPAPYVTHKFWLGLATAYMAVVTVLAAQIAAAPTDRRLLMLPLAAGKAVSSLTCLWFFVTEDRYFIYLANFLVDAGLAATAFGTWSLTRARRGPPGGGGSAAGMRHRDRLVLLRVAETLLPPDGAFASDRQVAATAARNVEAHLARIAATAPAGFGLILRLVDWTPPLFHLTPARFAELPFERRVQILEAMEHSRLALRRQIAHVLKLMVGLHVYRDPDVRRAIGADDGYLADKLRAAAERRARGTKGPYPVPSIWTPTQG